MLRRLLLITLCAVGVADAQPSALDFFPLDVGNRWLFFDREEVVFPGGGDGASVGTTDWQVVGTVSVGGDVLPLLSVSRDGGPGVTCAVRTVPDGSDGVAFAFSGADGTGDCDAAGFVMPVRDSSPAAVGFDVHAGDAVSLPREIGGFRYDLSVLDGLSFPTDRDGGSWTLAAGIGPLRLRDFVVPEPFVEDAHVSTLRYAEVGGAQFGAPLDPGADFFAPAVGDVWVYEAYRYEDDGQYVPLGVVIWTAVSDGGSDSVSLRVDVTRGGLQETLGVCGVGVIEPARVNYWQRTVKLDGGCDIAERFALPYSRLLGAEERGVRVGAYSPDGQFTIGGIDYVADDFRSSVGDRVDGKPTRIAQWRVARGIGVTEFGYFAPLFAEPRPVLTVLRYAEVGGAVYGVRPVSSDPPPPARQLTVSVGPNPARGPTRLTIGGDAGTVRVTVLDALGRVVEAREASPGTMDLDTSRWAAGIYVVHAESADGVATARLTVVR